VRHHRVMHGFLFCCNEARDTILKRAPTETETRAKPRGNETSTSLHGPPPQPSPGFASCGPQVLSRSLTFEYKTRARTEFGSQFSFLAECSASLMRLDLTFQMNFNEGSIQFVSNGNWSFSQ